MADDISRDYLNGFLDGAIKMTLSSCRNEGGYEMSAIAFECEKDELLNKLSGVLSLEEPAELVPHEKSFAEICRERFGKDRKSRKAIVRLEDMLISEFGEEKGLYSLKDDREARDSYSGYGGGAAPFYIVTQLFVILFENASVLFIIGSDE